jgi:hypothetical protein
VLHILFPHTVLIDCGLKREAVGEVKATDRKGAESLHDDETRSSGVHDYGFEQKSEKEEIRMMRRKRIPESHVTRRWAAASFFCHSIFS